ncbi:hypothetical protein [Telmatospirillum siberiense]|uniref:General secretion pathway protein GspM n=1 Tax=Telmatospirillum siberiense TaxID=382514 RepID=A0A2N3Q1I7_9PROT|nr:hypothetical protein [Telmatospirillum siberiense]PKU26519.1 hypothetical protein CWS72_01360 [Telmatospirillum siberiense]
MSAELRLDMTRLKALPRRLKIVLAVILTEVIVILGAYAVETVVDEQESRVAQLRAQLAQARRQSAELRRQIDQYPELRRRYAAAGDKGVLDNPNAVKLIADAQDMAGRHSLANLHYKVEPQAVAGPAQEKYRIGSTQVSFESGALLDADAMDFWDEVLQSLPSHYHVVEAGLERTADIDADLLNNLRAGRSVSAVRVRLSFQWLTLRTPAQEGP